MDNNSKIESKVETSIPHSVPEWWLVFNIETVADEEIGLDIIEDEPIKAPSNYKDPEKIQEYINNKRKEAYEKAGLHPLTNKIICVSSTLFNISSDSQEKTVSFYGVKTEGVLSAWFDYINYNIPVNCKLCGFNILAFDLPIIRIQAAIHRIELPHILSGQINDYTNVFDVYKFLSNYYRWQKGSLRSWAARFNVTVPYGDGSLVSELYQRGDFQSIIKHCESNVQATLEIFSIIHNYIRGV